MNQEYPALALEELAKKIETLDSDQAISHKSIWKAKLEVCQKYSLEKVPKNSEILEFIDPSKRKVFEGWLKRKSIRTRSGIAVVTAITMPFNCPHGTCTFCPGGPREGTPQSYTQNSPAAAFGMQRNFDPFLQVKDTLNLLERNGHDTSKVELILLGGTILAMPKPYQQKFVERAYDALNGADSSSMEEAKKRNELAAHRCVGLTIETKPDWCGQTHVDELLAFGATRVEIGVQSLQNQVLKATNRGHTLEDTYAAFKISRNASFKIVAHMMPGLPGSNPESDLDGLKQLFSDERLMPDMLKIYPTLVVEGTALYNQYKMGKYVPYTLEEIIDILCKFKRTVPPWVRIMRIQREIPKNEIAGGANAGNLRQLVREEMLKRGEECKCIRCRESGHRQIINDGVSYCDPEKFKLHRIDYKASSGQEVFLSYEAADSDTLFGFLRLRISSGQEHRKELQDQESSMVRELHVYGPVVPVGEKKGEDKFGTSPSAQHRGLGSRLLYRAERISKEEFDMKKQVVISASGTKQYYRVRGYSDDGAYVSKKL